MNDATLLPVPGEHIKIVTDTWTEPFWAAGKEDRLVVATCAECKTHRMPPTPFCPKCQSQSVEWPELSGRGTVYSYSICHASPFPGRVENMTYAPVIVELDDAPGIRLVSNLVNATLADLKIGLPVQVSWNPIQDGWKVPVFSPVRDGAN
jgi:uncharacterized OB-fold protein